MNAITHHPDHAAPAQLDFFAAGEGVAPRRPADPSSGSNNISAKEGGAAPVKTSTAKHTASLKPADDTSAAPTVWQEIPIGPESLADKSTEAAGSSAQIVPTPTDSSYAVKSASKSARSKRTKRSAEEALLAKRGQNKTNQKMRRVRLKKRGIRCVVVELSPAAVRFYLSLVDGSNKALKPYLCFHLNNLDGVVATSLLAAKNRD